MRLLLVSAGLWIGVGIVAVLADETAQKTDSAFVGDKFKSSNSFVGDQSKSIVNDAFIGENTMHQQTDGVFVGANTIKTQYNLFAGESHQQQAAKSTVPAFAQDNTATPSDGVFLGQDTAKKTDGSFAGANYGK